MSNKVTITKGFTIVELLIVVVIVAILASISIVAFTNIQTRAKNSQIQSTVEGYLKSLELYAIENDSFPTSEQAGSSRVCLGKFAVDVICANSGNIIPRVEFNELLSEYRGSSTLTELPNEFVYTNTYNNWWRGVWYETANQRLRYVQYGVSTCPSIARRTTTVSTAYDNNVVCNLVIGQ